MTIQQVTIQTKARRWRGAEYPSKPTGGFADIERNKSIRIHGTRNGTAYDRTFNVGDKVEIGSYNLYYLGFIEKITDKGITVIDEHDKDRPGRPAKRKRMSLDEFTWRNYDLDLVKIARENADTMMCI